MQVFNFVSLDIFHKSSVWSRCKLVIQTLNKDVCLILANLGQILFIFNSRLIFIIQSRIQNTNNNMNKINQLNSKNLNDLLEIKTWECWFEGTDKIKEK